MNVYLKQLFEEEYKDEMFFIIALNMDGCSGLEVIPKTFETKYDFINAYHKISPVSKFNPLLTENNVEEIEIYYDKGEFKTPHRFGGDVLSKDAVFVDEYYCVEYG